MRNLQRLLGDTQAEAEAEVAKERDNVASILGLVGSKGWNPLIMEWLEQKLAEYEVPSTTHDLMLEANGFRKGLRFVQCYFRELERVIREEQVKR